MVYLYGYDYPVYHSFIHAFMHSCILADFYHLYHDKNTE